MHRLRLDMQAADKERGRLETRLAAKEREIGGLTNKVHTCGCCSFTNLPHHGYFSRCTHAAKCCCCWSCCVAAAPRVAHPSSCCGP